MPEPDLWGTTRKLMELYGRQAEATALERAERCLSRGDRQGYQRWSEIRAAVQRFEKRITAA